MTPRPIMWAIAGSDDRSMKVRRDEDDEYDELHVTWLCGEKLAFTPEQLAQAVAHVEDLAPLDVWLRLRDVDEDEFVVKVANGRLHAKRGAFSVDEGDVEWSELRELIAPPPAMGTPYTDPAYTTGTTTTTTTGNVTWNTPAAKKPSRLRRLLRR